MELSSKSETIVSDFDSAKSTTESTHKNKIVVTKKLQTIGKGAFGHVVLVQYTTYYKQYEDNLSSLLRKLHEQKSEQQAPMKRKESLYRQSSMDDQYLDNSNQFSDRFQACKTKLIAKKYMSRSVVTEQEFSRESEIHRAMSGHACIVKCFASITHANKPDYFVLGMEYAPYGNLLQFVPWEIGLPDKLVRSCAVQISRALNHIHNIGFAHLDLKPDNILIYNLYTFHLKVGDFGSARNINKKLSLLSEKQLNPFMPPEMYCNDNEGERLSACEQSSNHKQDFHSVKTKKIRKSEMLPFDTHKPISKVNNETPKRFNSFPERGQSYAHADVQPQMDVWSFGMIVYYVTTGRCPWLRAAMSDWVYCNYSLWHKGEFSAPIEMVRHFRPHGWDLVSSWLHPIPEQRSTLLIPTDRLQVPWSIDSAEKSLKLRRHLFHYTRNKNWESIGLSKDIFCDPDANYTDTKLDDSIQNNVECLESMNRCKTCFCLNCICMGKFNDTTYKIISSAAAAKHVANKGGEKSLSLESNSGSGDEGLQKSFDGCDIEKCKSYQNQSRLKKKSSSLSKLVRNSLSSIFKSQSFDSNPKKN